RSRPIVVISLMVSFTTLAKSASSLTVALPRVSRAEPKSSNQCSGLSMQWSTRLPACEVATTPKLFCETAPEALKDEPATAKVSVAVPHRPAGAERWSPLLGGLFGSVKRGPNGKPPVCPRTPYARRDAPHTPVALSDSPSTPLSVCDQPCTPGVSLEAPSTPAMRPGRSPETSPHCP